MLNLFERWNRPVGKGVVLIGSCFSDNLKPHLEEEGYAVCSNEFGTLFHPIPIFNVLKYACKNAISEEEMQLVFHEDQWKSLLGGKMLRADSLESLKGIILSKTQGIHEALSKSEMLVITFGTAHAWMHESLGLVGNCQRLPQQVFKREIISLNEMIQSGEDCIRQIRELNPKLKIVLTVSPVKHWRMGILENARTKARCLELAHALSEQFSLVYFPSFEYVTDVLRNDEYFESDRCHPNERAISLLVQQFLKEGRSQ